MGEPVSPRTQKKKKKVPKQLNWIWTEKKLCAHCSELSHGAFSLLAAGSCSHNCMGLNPVSHFVVRSPFSSPMLIKKSPWQAVGHKNNNNNKINTKCKQVSVQVTR